MPLTDLLTLVPSACCGTSDMKSQHVGVGMASLPSLWGLQRLGRLGRGVTHGVAHRSAPSATPFSPVLFTMNVTFVWSLSWAAHWVMPRVLGCNIGWQGLSGVGSLGVSAPRLWPGQFRPTEGQLLEGS